MTSPAQKQETVNQGGTEYLLLRGWVNNRNLSIVSVIGFLERKKIPIVYVDNPEVPALKAAGKSYSPTSHAIPNTEINRALLAEFAEGRTRTPVFQPKQQTQQPQLQIQPQIQPVQEAVTTSNSQSDIEPSDKKDLRSCDIYSLSS